MTNKFSFFVSVVIHILIFFLNITTGHAIDFNTALLDAEDKRNIDFSRFSQPGYILPGEYMMQVMVNNQSISPTSFPIKILDSSDSDKKTLPQACITSEIIERIGLTESSLKKVTFFNNGQCANFNSLPGVEIHPETAKETLYINIPQSLLEYSDEYWLPPSRWDNGIPGILLDYNFNGIMNKKSQGKQSQLFSYNGTAGGNVGAWRLRADYQGRYTNDGYGRKDSDFRWNRFYMYRAIPHWRANLTLGENYTHSDIFSTWRYTGASLESDDRMLPPKLRGYAPQISGIADTNARVVISQQGRILYDSTVPAGSFTIKDLDSSVRGRLDVEVIEQNGQKKKFQVNTAYVPYLTRPGQIRYKLISGRARTVEHTTEGASFVAGEASWGISNSWSLYGGSILTKDYNALAVGLGRDLNEFGTLSADVVQSVAHLPEEGIKQGKSWSLRYSKFFDDVNADIQFTGYRFSERNYMTMQQYLDARYHNNFIGREKEQYDLTVNKWFGDNDVSLGFQYSYQTYWDRRASNYYALTLNRYFNAFGIKGISVGLSASRTQHWQKGIGNTSDNSVFLNLTVPWNTGMVNYNGSKSNDLYTNMIGYSNSLNEGLDNYSLNIGTSTGKEQSAQKSLNAYYNHSSSLANLSANISSVQDEYTSLGMSASGGATITSKGAALHAGGMNGGTRLMIDTDGISDVPVDGGRVYTNRWGIGVVTDMNSYYRNTTSVDVNKLPNDMEATHPVVETTLTEGAIGYHKIGVLKGSRLFAVIRLADNSQPPFGASVTNTKGRELGMVADDGLAWLSGVTSGENLNVSWDGKIQCMLDIPKKLEASQQLLLPCHKTK